MILAGGVFIGNDTCMKLVMDHAPPLQVVFMRGIAACLWCLAIVLMLGLGPKIPMMFNPWLMLRALGEVFAVLCFAVALPHMALADLTAIYQISPLLLLAGAALIFGERVGVLRLALVACAIIGALMVAQPGSTAASAYAVLGFGTAVGGAARDIVTRKVPHDIPVPVVALAMTVIVMSAAGAGTGLFEDWVPPEPRHVLLMAASGAFLAAGQFFLFLAFRHASAPTLAPFFYTFTIWALVVGFLVFGNVPDMLSLIGMVLILASGVAVVLLDGRRYARSAVPGE